jgi:O-antigen ligase
MQLALLKSLVLLLSVLIALGNIDALVGIEGSIGFVELVLVAFVFVYFLAHPRDVLAFRRTRAHYIFIISLILSVSGLFYIGSSYELPVYNFKLLICIVFFVALCGYFARYPEQVHRSLLAFSLGAIVFAALVLFVFPGVTTTVRGQLIVMGENPNSTSGRLAVSFIYIAAVCILNPLKVSKARFILLGASLPVLYLIVASGSRGSLLAVLVASAVLLLYAKIKLKYKVFGMFAVVASAPYFVGYLLSQDGIADRWLSAADGDTAGRDTIWIDAIGIFLRNPIFGTGEAGYFQEIYYKQGVYIDTHNLFLYIAVCGGFVSLGLFLMFLLSLFQKARSAARAGNVFPFVLLVYVFLIASKTGGVLTYLLMWYLFALVYAFGTSEGRRFSRVAADRRYSNSAFFALANR